MVIQPAGKRSSSQKRKNQKLRQNLNKKSANGENERHKQGYD